MHSFKLFVDGRTDGRTFETHFIRLTKKNRPKKHCTMAQSSHQPR